MEISNSAIIGIRFLNDKINEDISEKLIENAIMQLLKTGMDLNFCT